MGGGGCGWGCGLLGPIHEFQPLDAGYLREGVLLGVEDPSYLLGIAAKQHELKIVHANRGDDLALSTFEQSCKSDVLPSRSDLAFLLGLMPHLLRVAFEEFVHTILR